MPAIPSVHVGGINAAELRILNTIYCRACWYCASFSTLMQADDDFANSSEKSTPHYAYCVVDD